MSALVLAIASLVLGACSDSGGDRARAPGADRRGDEPRAGAAAPEAGASTEPERYFPASFFTQRLVDDAALDPQSQELSRQLANLAYGVDPATAYRCDEAVLRPPGTWTPEERATCAQLTTRAGISGADFRPPVYTVSKDQPKVAVAIDANAPELAAALAEGVPIPADAEPAPGSDHQLIIWQPQTDTMWELWRARKDESGAWHAGFGGRIEDVSQSPGHYRDRPEPSGQGFTERHNWGGPSSSIPNLPGLITAEQLRSGEIGHALVFATWTNQPGQWVYPAQRTDGQCRGAYCSQIPQGARFRLDPDYDVSRLEHPIVRMIATAVRDYGMVLNNTTGGGVLFYVEGRPAGEPDPYAAPEGLFGADPAQPQPTAFMREFPWEELEMLRRGTSCDELSVECPAPGSSAR